MSSFDNFAKAIGVEFRSCTPHNLKNMCGSGNKIYILFPKDIDKNNVILLLRALDKAYNSENEVSG